MNKETSNPRIGLVTVACKYESGGQRGDEITRRAVQLFSKQGLDVFTPGFTVWEAHEAEAAVAQLAGEQIDLVLILHCTWVLDSLQYQIVNGLHLPVMLWALPFPETFSLASVQHFSSVLTQNNKPSLWVYGLPEDSCVQEKIRRYAQAAQAANCFSHASIGLVGYHPTHRFVGPQDTVFDEWNLSSSLGTRVVHIEMDAFQAALKSVADAEAKEVVESMKATRRYGEMQVEEKRILHSAKVYLAVKKMLWEYHLAGLTVECYPYFGGLVNLASAWLADEGIVLDPEGDVGHTMLAALLNTLSPGPTALAETMLLNWEHDRFYLRHEGSTAFSLAGDPAKVEVIPAGDDCGTIVQFPMRPMPLVSVASLCGRDHTHTLFTGHIIVEELPAEQWRQWGGNFQVAARPAHGLDALLKNIFGKGMDHHWLLKEGDLVDTLGLVANLWGLHTISLDEE